LNIEYLRIKQFVETKSKKIAAMTKELLAIHTGEIGSKRTFFS
jgi:hypothetical protein